MPRGLLVLLLMATAILAFAPRAEAANDLAVTALTVAPDPVATGSSFTVTITVANRGVATRYVGIRWEQPAAVAVTGFQCPPGFSQSPGGSTICEQGYLGPGETAVMAVSGETDQPGSFAHKAMVSPIPDDDVTNNEMSGTITAIGPPPGDTPDVPSRPGGTAPGADGPEGLLSALSVTPERFRRGRRATVRYTLARSAVTVFTVARARPGRRVGGRCVAATRVRRTKPPCTRWVRVAGSIVRSGRAGTNTMAFSGRLAGRHLLPGAYRLTARAHVAEAAAERSAPFRIV